MFKVFLKPRRSPQNPHFDVNPHFFSPFFFLTDFAVSEWTQQLHFQYKCAENFVDVPLSSIKRTVVFPLNKGRD